MQLEDRAADFQLYLLPVGFVGAEQRQEIWGALARARYYLFHVGPEVAEAKYELQGGRRVSAVSVATQPSTPACGMDAAALL